MKQKTLKEVEEQTKGQELLVIKSNEDFLKTEPITTTDRIAKFTGYNKNTIHVLIEKYKEQFNLVSNRGINLKLRPANFIDNTGRIQTQQMSYYELDEQQAYFLMTLMRNNEVIIKFKAQLVNAFFSMKHTIEKSQQTKPIAIAYNKSFHDTINIFNGGEENDFTHWSYKLYNNEVYKIILGETAKQRRLRLGLKRDANIDNTLTAAEHIAKYKLEEEIRKTAIKNGWHKLPSKECYNKVKEFLFKKTLDN